MESKKTAQASLENKKKSFFLFGLLTALGFMFMAFEWTSFEANYEMPTETGILIETEPAVKIINIERPKPMRSTPPETQKPITTMVKIDNTLEDDTAQIVKLDPTKLIGEIIINDSIDFGEPTVGPVKTNVPFKVVEEMPMYGESDQDLFAYLGKKIKYTQFARELGIEGKVYVQFVVEKDGTITNVKLVRGLEASLDELAVKTIKEMGKWSPGKQRGKEVRVQQVIPIDFQLH